MIQPIQSNSKRCVARTALCLPLALLCAWIAPVDARPNVLLIMTDDQGYADMSCHGHPILQTPNIDKLSSQSVRLTDFHVDPFCTPTRAALMTGRFSHRTGATATYSQRNLVRLNETLMPQFFKASGYRTGLFGKWHLGANYPYRPMDRGFDEWLGLGNGGLGIADDLWDNDRMNDRYWHNGAIVSRKGFSTDVYFDSAMDFMRSCHQRGQPFFTFLATNVPHRDNNVPPSWMSSYLQQGCDKDQAAFYAGIDRVDWNLGRLMAFLDQHELSANTIVIFMTDNGTILPLRELGTQTDRVSGMRGMKNDLYDGGHRVPCFIRGPQPLLGAPRDITALTAQLDLLPTLIDLCQLDDPVGQRLTLDGRSLRPLLSEAGAWPPRTLYLHGQNGWRGPKQYTKGCVLTSRWRLILKQPGTYELYDIKADPAQTRDVAAEHAPLVAELIAQYEAYWSSLVHEQPLSRPQISEHAETKLTSGWQRQIRQASGAAGRWELEVVDPGRYRVEVRRWPREAGEVAMCAGLPPAQDPDLEYVGLHLMDVPGKALDIQSVELKLSDRDMLRKPLASGASSVDFELDLPTANVELRAYLVFADGTKNGAYYVYVSKL
jgi:arylsulfatase A-like enzyme